ncbi:hypothetical protein GA0061099_10165 [Bradyrhizobium yuanmingense]|uniref:Uncharacterized protein n=1 Tax=Bradyrhizobium yuanmingense TaxID=108015 RepID=A0A1C3XGW2_9BRAD|nr:MULTISPECIES: hypothetical protein [Bradyrhizobium]MCA1544337.1 hypothetical protein [Bradyrhizobium sp. NBAIM32]TWI18759.1 hypothetical protein IQ15_07068 [Bradyrhizobium yuanmingense]SCB51214.1 hypothetical protein GA0061099_10165 [Bradyrhizobium yuanmingense]
MDPFSSINPFDRDHAAVSQPQQQQAEFEPYLDEVPQLDAPAVAEIPASSDPYYFPLSEEERSLIEALDLGHQAAHGPHPEDAVTRHLGDTAAEHSAPREAWTWPKELPAEGHDQDPLRGMMGEPNLTSSLPTARDHQGPDRGKAVQFNWSDGYQPARNELTGSAPSSSHEVLMGEDYTGELRPAKRQRTLSHTEGDAIGRQVSEPGSSVVREPMEDAGAPFQASDRLVLPAEGYDQDLLWAMVGNAGPSSSVQPTEGHHQGLDSEPAVIPFNFRQGHQHASAALDRSNVAPSQDSRPNSFIVHNDRYTALFVPAATMRRSTPLPQGAAIPLGFRLENAPQPSAQPANRASSSRLGRSMEQAAPASSSRAEGTSPAPREIYAASFAVPKNFSHGDQPAPDTMLSMLRRWGQLPNDAHPAINYDILGERYTALLGPGGPNDVRLIHHPSNGDAERQSPR